MYAIKCIFILCTAFTAQENITASNAGNQSEELLSVVTSNNSTRLSVTDLTVIADVVGAISTLELDQITTTQVSQGHCVT